MKLNKFLFGKPTIDLQEAKNVNTSKVIDSVSSFTNSNGNKYYITKLKRCEPIPKLEKINIIKKISSFIGN